MPRHPKKIHYYVPTAGVRDDFLVLINEFIKLKTVRFSEFSELWRSKKMSFLCAGRCSDREAREFVDRAFLIAMDFFLPPFQFQVRVGGLYLLYSLFETQPIFPKTKVRITQAQWKETLQFQHDARQQNHLDVVYVFNKMLQDHAFHFCFTATEMSSRSYPHDSEKSDFDFAEDMRDEKRDINALFNYESMEQLSYLLDHYQQMKINLAGPSAMKPDKSLDIVQGSMVEDLVMMLQSFKKSVGNIHKHGRPGDVKTEEGQEEKPAESIQSRRQALKAKAFSEIRKQGPRSNFIMSVEGGSLPHSGSCEEIPSTSFDVENASDIKGHVVSEMDLNAAPISKQEDLKTDPSSKNVTFLCDKSKTEASQDIDKSDLIRIEVYSRAKPSDPDFKSEDESHMNSQDYEWFPSSSSNDEKYSLDLKTLNSQSISTCINDHTVPQTASKDLQSKPQSSKESEDKVSDSKDIQIGSIRETSPTTFHTKKRKKSNKPQVESVRDAWDLKQDSVENDSSGSSSKKRKGKKSMKMNLTASEKGNNCQEERELVHESTDSSLTSSNSNKRGKRVRENGNIHDGFNTESSTDLPPKRRKTCTNKNENLTRSDSMSDKNQEVKESDKVPEKKTGKKCKPVFKLSISLKEPSRKEQIKKSPQKEQNDLRKVKRGSRTSAKITMPKDDSWDSIGKGKKVTKILDNSNEPSKQTQSKRTEKNSSKKADKSFERNEQTKDKNTKQNSVINSTGGSVTEIVAYKEVNKPIVYSNYGEETKPAANKPSPRGHKPAKVVYLVQSNSKNGQQLLKSITNPDITSSNIKVLHGVDKNVMNILSRNQNVLQSGKQLKLSTNLQSAASTEAVASTSQSLQGKGGTAQSQDQPPKIIKKEFYDLKYV